MFDTTFRIYRDAVFVPSQIFVTFEPTKKNQLASTLKNWNGMKTIWDKHAIGHTHTRE